VNLGLIALVAAGFHCSGRVCVGRLPGAYPEPVAFVLPSSPPAPGRYILHLVGNAEPDVDIEKDVLDRFHFDRLLDESGRSEIMILPANRGPRQTQRDVFMCHYQTVRDRKLSGAALDHCRAAAEKRFDRFMAAAVGVLRKAGLAKTDKVDRLTLSGHSGAYAPMAAILGNPAWRGRVKEAYCYDCMYGEEDVFADFARRGGRLLAAALRGERTELGDFRIWSAFHSKELRGIEKRFAGQRANILSVGDPDQRQRRLNALDAVIMKESGFAVAVADEPKDWCGASWRVVASATPDHFETVSRYLPLFLRACPEKTQSSTLRLPTGTKK
jgi:hypothetical protein